MATAPAPSFASPAERSAARLADIELGLGNWRDADRRYWLEIAAMRITALEDDADSYGLFANEETELAALRILIAR